MSDYLISFTIEPRKQSWPRIFDDMVSHNLPRAVDLKRVRELIAKRSEERFPFAEFSPADVVILGITELDEHP